MALLRFQDLHLVFVTFWVAFGRNLEVSTKYDALSKWKVEREETDS
jgi:hypothetical protein